MKVRIEPLWGEVLEDYFESKTFAQLSDFVRSAYETKRVYPPAKHIFAAFDSCPWDQIRVVILGQDPYHGPGQAHGLCFSVPEGVEHPPSLQNIFKELNRDLSVPLPQTGDLSPWARQGVLLLNAVLTVCAGSPNSHQGKGWETFTDTVIECLSDQKEQLVFMLWGSYAQRKGAQIDPSKHLVLKTAHPSPLSVHRGFSGCGHFSEANAYLETNGHRAIDWSLEQKKSA